MADKQKNLVMTDIIPMMFKITERKLIGTTYLDWCKIVRIYLRSISMDNHLTADPPTDNTHHTWLRDDARLFLQIRNSIDTEMVK